MKFIKNLIVNIIVIFSIFISNSYSISHYKTALNSQDLNLITIEVADTRDKQATGLMNRDELCKQCAMLFVYSYPSTQQFWMKNTKISLDIIFMDKNGKIIKIHQNTKPLDTSIKYSAGNYYWYVLEANAGFVQQYDLISGDYIDIQDLMLKSGVLSKNK